MAKPQFNNRQKNISRVVRAQRMNAREKLRATGKFKKTPQLPFSPQK